MRVIAREFNSIAADRHDNDRAQAMFMFTLLSTFLVLSRVRAIADGDRDSRGTPVPHVSLKDVYDHPAYVDLALLRRRLLEQPRWVKQAYRGGDCNVIRQRRRHARSKPGEGRSYRSVVKNEDEDEEEEEEEEEEKEEEDEGNEIDDDDDEAVDEEGEHEETVNEESGEVYDYG